MAKLPANIFANLTPENGAPQLAYDPSVFGGDTSVSQPSYSPPSGPIDTSQLPDIQNLAARNAPQFADLQPIQKSQISHPNGFFNGPQGFLGGIGKIADIVAAIGGAHPGFAPAIQARNDEEKNKFAQNLFGQLINNPGDANAFAQLARVNPEAAMKVQPFLQSAKDQALAKQATGLYAAGDVAGAKKAALAGGNLSLATQLSSMTAADHAEAFKAAQSAAPLWAALKALPQNQRAAALHQNAQQFAARGIDPSHLPELAGDLSDSVLDQNIAAGQSPEDYFKAVEKAADRQAEQDKPYNLGQGETRFGPGGKIIASVAPKPEYVTTPEGSTSTLVNGGAPGAPTASGGHYSGPALGPQIESTVAKLVPGATITSGARTVAHNAAVGGVSNSYHLTNDARDFVPPSGMSMGSFAGLVKNSMPGFTVLNEGTHVHVQPGPGMAAQAAPTAGGPPSVIRGAPKPEDAVPQLSQAAIEGLAQQVASGGDVPALGMGKAAAGLKAQIYNRAAEINQANGNDGAAMVNIKAGRVANAAALRDLTKRNSLITAAKNTAQSNGDLVVQAAATGAAGSGMPMINAWQQAYRNNIQGSPDVAKFGLAINTFANEYAKVVSGATGSAGVAEGARQEMLKHLSTASTPQQVSAIIDQAKKEMASSTNAMAGQITNTQSALRNGARTNAPTTQPSGGWGKAVAIR